MVNQSDRIFEGKEIFDLIQSMIELLGFLEDEFDHFFCSIFIRERLISNISLRVKKIIFYRNLRYYYSLVLCQHTHTRVIHDRK